MMSSLVFLVSCCLLLSLVRADDFWWADKVDKDKETRHKHGKYVIKDDTGKILKKINVKGYLLNEVKIEKSNVKILVLAVDMLPKDSPEHAMSASNIPNNSECIIRREEAQHNPNPYIIPECDENGDYSDRQCLYDNPEMCQCWNKERKSISGDFKKIVHCKCYQERASAITKQMIGVFVPQCEDNGLYKSKQCWGSTGMCWCVNSSGEKISEPTRYGVNCPYVHVHDF